MTIPQGANSDADGKGIQEKGEYYIRELYPQELAIQGLLGAQQRESCNCSHLNTSLERYSYPEADATQADSQKLPKT